MHVIKTESPLRLKGVYRGENWVELYENKDKTFYWITYSEDKKNKTIYGWNSYVDAEFEMDKILLKMEIKKGV